MADRVIRSIRIEGQVAYVPLTRGYEATIDVDDISLVECFNWYALKNGKTVYAVRHGPTEKCGKRSKVSMHRTLLSPLPGVEVDHIDRCGTNNRRSNLRQATRAQNLQNRGLSSNNRAGHKGVSWHKRAKKWRAALQVNGSRIYLGLFGTVEAAADAYAQASTRHHQEFGRVD